MAHKDSKIVVGSFEIYCPYCDHRLSATVNGNLYETVAELELIADDGEYPTTAKNTQVKNGK